MTPLLATSLREEMGPAIILAAFLAVSAVVWAWVCFRWQRGAPIIALARRRPVPWRAQDVLFLFLLGVLLPLLAITAVQAWMGPADGQEAAAQKTELAHPAEQLLHRGNRVAVAIAVVMAVVVAPLNEEFFYRVLLQGWLEAVWSRRRRAIPALRATPLRWIPIVLPALIFALRHFRSDRAPLAPQYQAGLFLGQMVADLLVLGISIALLRFAAGATAADMGWKPEKLRSDAGLGLIGLLAAIGPVLALQVGLAALVTATGLRYAPDPIPLFFLALVLGALYHRTHRIAPSLVLHMTFNATSIVLLLAGT